MSKSNKCCEKCSTLDGYKVGENCYQKLCPCHSTTPDTEWESVEDYVREFQKMALTFVIGEGEIEKMARLSNFFLDALTSRDTYWKERVREAYKDKTNGL